MNFYTANIFDTDGLLRCVFVAFSPTSAEFAFDRSEHFKTGASLYVYDGYGHVILTKIAP